MSSQNHDRHNKNARHDSSSSDSTSTQQMKARMKARFILFGCGQRGKMYSDYIHRHPQDCELVAVVEPIERRRNAVGDLHNIVDALRFNTWEDLLANSSPTTLKSTLKWTLQINSAIIATLDHLHAKLATELAELGLHILCEKPLSTTLQDCHRITQSVIKNHILFGVGHVLRYAPINRLVRELVMEKQALGDVINIQHMEPVGWYHFAHSYVRGNWRNTSTSSFSLLTKSCHDIDLLLFFAPSSAHPTHISSFGSLTHFTKRNKPSLAGTATKCVDCNYEPNCPYSAIKIYEGAHKNGVRGWPCNVLTDQVEDIENIRNAIREGPYGRCVYECDNDVCDNQVVTLTSTTPYGTLTSSFTMIAFTEQLCIRQTKIFGSRGELQCDGEKVTIFEFNTGEKKTYYPDLTNGFGGHGGGDGGLMGAFVDGVKEVLHRLDQEGATSIEEIVQDAQSRFIGCTPEQIFESHLLVFAAEEARLTKSVVDLDSFRRNLDDSMT